MTGRARRHRLRAPTEATYFKRRVLFFLALVILITLFYFIFFQEKAKIEGYVSDYETGKPLHNTTVRIKGRSTLTDKEGRYELGQIKPGKYLLTAEAKGYEKKSRKISVERGKNRFDFALSPNIVKGQVKSESTQKPVSKALVILEKRKALTNQKGEFVLEKITPGKKEVKVIYKKQIIFKQKIKVKNGKTSLLLLAASTASSDAAKHINLKTPEKEIFKPIQPQVIKRGNPRLKRVAITIDDGWNKDDRILDLMEKYHIRATVFVIGGRGIGEKHPDWIKRMDRLGFEVCTHTYSHYILTGLSNAKLTEDLRKGQMAITGVTHKMYPYMRPCGGIYDERTLKVVAQNGFKMVLWSNRLNDTTSGKTVSQMVNTTLKNLKNGDIILCHFGGHHTYEALKILIPEILKRGYKIVTVSEVLEGT